MYEIIDQFGDVFTGDFESQDGLFRSVAAMYRGHLAKDFSKFTMMYVDDEDEGQTLLGYVGDTFIRDWVSHLAKLEIDLRILQGTDIMGLADFVGTRGFTIDYIVCDCPDNVLCRYRYGCRIQSGQAPLQITAYGEGMHRIEALAHAYLSVSKKDYFNGKHP